MSTITKPNTFTAGTTVVSSQVNANFDTIYADYNGNITSANLSASANISDTMLAQITTASKVHGSALTGTLVFTKGADIASASTTDIGAATGNLLDVTGVTTITGLGTVASGAYRIVRFTGILTLTHNATSLILPTGANITTQAGDVASFESLGSGNWVCLHYQRKDGTALVATTSAGMVIQVVNTQTGAVATGATAIPYDDTIPQITEGNEYMTLAITPTSATNKLRISVVCNVANSGGARTTVALFQDATANALAAVNEGAGSGAGQEAPTCFTHYMTSGTTSSTTFRVRAGTTNPDTVTFNGSAGARKLGGVIASSITIEEIKV